MDDRHRRRVHLSKIGVKAAVEKFGSICSPFHSLELSVSRIFFVLVTRPDVNIFLAESRGGSYPQRCISCTQQRKEVKFPEQSQTKLVR